MIKKISVMFSCKKLLVIILYNLKLSWQLLCQIVSLYDYITVEESKCMQVFACLIVASLSNDVGSDNKNIRKMNVTD